MVIRSNSPSLTDVMTRHQIYLEGLKDGYAQNFIPVMVQMRKELRQILSDLDVENMGALTRRELQQLIARLRAAQIARFSSYTGNLIQDLEDFLEADLEMNVAIMRDTQKDDKAKLALLAALLLPKRRKQLWVTINSAPLPANGVLPDTFLKRLVASATFMAESEVRRAYANKMTVQQTITSLIGTSSANYRNGVLNRLIFQANGVTNSLLQHVASHAHVSAASLYYPTYIWLSILDGVTSDICRSRNGMVFRYGDGPLPPAHPNCRSKAVPYDADDFGEVPTSYYSWLQRQPEPVQNDILGKVRAEALRNGELSSAKLPKFNDATALTLAQFVAKLNLIIFN